MMKNRTVLIIIAILSTFPLLSCGIPKLQINYLVDAVARDANYFDGYWSGVFTCGDCQRGCTPSGFSRSMYVMIKRGSAVVNGYNSNRYSYGYEHWKVKVNKDGRVKVKGEYWWDETKHVWFTGQIGIDPYNPSKEIMWFMGKRGPRTCKGKFTRILPAWKKKTVATKRKEIFHAEEKSLKEIEVIKKEIEEIKSKPDQKKDQPVVAMSEQKADIPKTETSMETLAKLEEMEKRYEEERVAQWKAKLNKLEVDPSKVEAEKQEKIVQLEEKPTSEAETQKADYEKQERIAQLEARLIKLTEALTQLEEMEKKFEEERKKTALLTEELAEKEIKEKNLLSKLEYAKKTPPVIIIASPEDGSKVEANVIHLSVVAEDNQGLKSLEVFINNKLLEKKVGRGIKVKGEKYSKRLDFAKRIALERGENKIKICAVDSDGLSTEKILTVHKLEIRKNIWAAVIGINNYPNVHKLLYAVNDAKAFYDHLVHYSHIPAENVTLLLNEEASLTRLRSILGTHLKSKAGKDDMVIIYFAGHGATEKDVMSPDGDGLEKYLLPYDANPKDLYASALPMREISHVFHRIRSERLIFLVDSCYSGASGGRTISLTEMRANISDAFLDRIASGKGRIILTASGANEVSVEDEKLQHGVFTYFLLEGLRGKADTDKDGVITVDEVYGYVSKHVPQATGQDQHPVKKGTVEGRFILGIVN